MTQIQFNFFDNDDQSDKEITCVYLDDTYTVRDNGTIFRHRRNEARLRPLDEKWTYGRPREQDSYMFIAAIQVHRIVATAFHGIAPSKNHVVDHIDTNRRNNRPENLRWVSKLDNILLNPITRRRVEIAYGSIANFIKDPSQPLNGILDPNYDWMRAVSKEEAEESKKNMLEWASKDLTPKGGILDERVFGTHSEIEIPEIEEFTKSLTDNAKQKYWKTPSKFPLCPTSVSKKGLGVYKRNLKEGEVFAINDFGESIVHSAQLSEELDSLFVLCEMPEGVKKWSLAKISIDKQYFIHESLGTFFKLDGAQKQLTLNLGLEWTGGQTFDDLC